MSRSAGHGRRAAAAGGRAPQSPSVVSQEGTPVSHGGTTPTTAFESASATTGIGGGIAPPFGDSSFPTTTATGNSGATNPFFGRMGAAADADGDDVPAPMDFFSAAPTTTTSRRRQQEGREPPGNVSFGSAAAAAAADDTTSAPPPPEEQTGIMPSESLPDFLRFGPTAAATSTTGATAAPGAHHHHHHHRGATSTSSARIMPGGGALGLLVQTSDASTETPELLSVDDEISLAHRELRDLDEQLAAAADRTLSVEGKLLLADDELRIKEMAAQRAIDAAAVELDRVRSSGREYADRKVQQAQDDQFVEAKKVYDELKSFHEQRRARLKLQLGEEKTRIQKEVTDMSEKRDLLEQGNGGANETRALRMIHRAKTVHEKIAVASEIAAGLAQQLKVYVGENLRDLVRGETINAFDAIRRDTLEQRQLDKKARADGMAQFQRDAVERSQELLRARDDARQRRLKEHQALLERARNRATKSTTDSTQALLDQVTASHEDAMRKFKLEFDSQHQHVKEMHSLVVKDDKQLDGQKYGEARQRFESHRKMAKELLDADAQALGHAKEREATMWAATTAEADPHAAAAIAQTVMSSVVRGTADVQRRLSALASTVRAQVAAMERQASVRKVVAAAAAANSGSGGGGGGSSSSAADHIEEHAAVGELKKMLASAMERRLDNHKKLEQGVSQFVSVVEKCGSVAQVQRNEVKTTSSHAMLAQQQWEGELRRMMADFSIIAATKQQQHHHQPGETPATTTATTPVGFLLSTINDCVERLSSQLRTVADKVVRPVDAQRHLLSAAAKEDAERQNAHSTVNAKVMKIFQMFESADSAMDSIRQREDEVRVEEISLAAQQRQLAEERRSFSVKCESMRRAVEQTERESQSAQTREREARRELCDSERQLAALAIEQRTLVARAATDSGAGVGGMSSVRASTFVDPMSGVSPSSSSSHNRQQEQQHEGRTTINPYYRGMFADRTNVSSAGGAAAAAKMASSPSANKKKFADAPHCDNNTTSNTHGGFTTAAEDDCSLDDGVSSGENLRRMKARFAAGGVGAGGGGVGTSSGSPGGNQADVSGGGDSSTTSRFSGIYGVPPVRGAGMSAMAAAVSPPATASRTTTSSRR